MKLWDALERLNTSSFESDHEMLHEEINKSEVDWDWAIHLCIKRKAADDAFKLIEKIKERNNNNGVEEKEKDKSGTNGK